MPYLSVQTNISVNSQQKPLLLAELSQQISKILGKPESYVMIALDDARPMLFAGSDAPTAYLQLKSLGLHEQQSAEYSAALCELVSKQLGIDTARIYIEFSSPARHLWGWDGRTF